MMMTLETYMMSHPQTSSSGEFSTVLHALPTYRRSKTMLPESFQPCPYSVVLGRGKVNDSIGNRRLKILVDIELDNYQRAKSRKEKSYVVARVMETIQEACGVGAFIRNDDGTWYEVDDATAREKVGTMFRDKLSDQYKSSTSNKVKRRRQRKAQRQTSVEKRPVSLSNIDLSRMQTEIQEDDSFLGDSSSDSSLASI